METLTETTIDKTQWIRGPWDKEVDKKQWLDLKTGLPCLIVRHGSSGHLCGYVGIDSKHPLFGKTYGEIAEDLYVHGGLTFSGECGGDICHKVEEGEDDNIWWLGFDCAHSGDLTSFQIHNESWKKELEEEYKKIGYPEDVYRTIDYVARQCRKLAKQLIALKPEQLSAPEAA